MVTVYEKWYNGAMNKHEYHTFGYFVKSIRTVVSVVLVWRGIWYLLDGIDKYIFGGSHWLTGLLGFALGILLMWLPDHDLSEISKL